VRVRAAQLAALQDALTGNGARVIQADGGAIEVQGLSSEQIGEIAAAQQLVLHELTPLQASLEDAFMSLTKDAVEYQQV
jgi:ABC-2 type transport system ATP-binding protein